jgi:steroid delta-isomerase
MPAHDQMVATVHAYVDAFDREDIDAIVRLFAPNATVEDPIGTPVHRGTKAIRAFYAMPISMHAKLTLEGPVRTVDGIAAFPFSVTVPIEGARRRIDVIDTFSFDENGMVLEMHAYWGPENVHQL